MRTITLLPFTALIAAAAGCASGARESATREPPQRDLTLVTQTSAVEIAAPVEMQQPPRAARRARAPRSSPVQPTVILASVATPVAAPVPTAAEPVAQPASTASSSDNSRELLPGKTITIIPASNGPSAGPDETDELPGTRDRTMVTRGGGKCGGRGRGRGPGIGIATAPRPDFRGR